MKKRESNAKARELAVVGTYEQSNIKGRIEQFFLENMGKIATTAQIKEVARNPATGVVPENWHQRLSELRTDSGYTIQTRRDTTELRVGKYVLVGPEKRKGAGKRIVCSPKTWLAVLERAANTCEWLEDGARCGLEEGAVDDVGGGTVRLTADHMKPHSAGSNVDPDDPKAWRALCGRHQVMKKNYWDSTTGKINITALLQAASDKDKRAAYKFLKSYFGKK
jgi:hypothetical protein